MKENNNTICELRVVCRENKKTYPFRIKTLSRTLYSTFAEAAIPHLVLKYATKEWVKVYRYEIYTIELCREIEVDKIVGCSKDVTICLSDYPMTDKHEELYKRVQDTESHLHDIVGDCVGRWFTKRHEECEYEQLLEHLYHRSKLLDEMFVATPEEVKRMEQVNARLLEFTNMMFARTEELYRKMMSSTYDPAFDNDVDVEGTLKFEMDEPDSILPMSNDAYYGSNFAFVFEIIGCLYTHNYLRREEIESSYCYCPHSTYRADMSREEMQIAENLNDGNSWYEACQPAADKLNHLSICHAIYDLNMHKPYSIPNILRMNDFTVEVAVKHQHYATQKGRGEVWLLRTQKH